MSFIVYYFNKYQPYNIRIKCCFAVNFCTSNIKFTSNRYIAGYMHNCKIIIASTTGTGPGPLYVPKSGPGFGIAV